MYRIGLLNTNGTYRRLLEASIAAAPDFILEFSTERITEAHPVLRKRIDVLLSEMPADDGPEGLCLTTHLLLSGKKIVYVTEHANYFFRQMLLEAGMSLVLPKDEFTPDEMLEEIAALMRTGTCGALAAAKADNKAYLGQVAGDLGMTPRTAQLMAEFKKGHSLQVAADRVSVSLATAKREKNRIKDVLQCSSDLELKEKLKFLQIL